MNLSFSGSNATTWSELDGDRTDRVAITADSEKEPPSPVQPVKNIALALLTLELLKRKVNESNVNVMQKIVRHKSVIQNTRPDATLLQKLDSELLDMTRKTLSKDIALSVVQIAPPDYIFTKLILAVILWTQLVSQCEARSLTESSFVNSYLLHRYSFNDGTAGDSVSGLNATLEGGAAIRGDRVILNPSLSSYIELPPNILGSSATISLEMWVTTGDSNVAAERLFQIGEDDNTNDNSIILCQNDGNNFIAMFLDNSGLNGVASTTVFNSHLTDVHLVMTIASSGGTRTALLYTDGQVTATLNTANTLPGSTAGGWIGRAFGGFANLNATINEFRVWSTALSADQVLENYNQGPDNLVPLPTAAPTASPSAAPSVSPTASPTVAAALLHRYSFNDGTARDSISGLNGTLEGGAAVRNGRVVLDPSSLSYVLLPPTVADSSPGMSLEMWVETGSGNGGSTRIYQSGTSFSTNGNSIHLYNNGVNIEFQQQKDSNIVVLTSGVAFNSQASDVHIVVTFATSNGVTAMALYIDGALSQSGTSPVGLTTSSAGGYLGRSFGPDPYLNGSINEFRVWNAALTADQVAFHHSLGPDVYELVPSAAPTLSLSPSVSPSEAPSPAPSVSPTAAPSESPTVSPSVSPTLSMSPSVAPSDAPTVSPSTFVGSYLLHRYSFNDGTAGDSISGLDGSLASGATVVNGRVHLDPSLGSYVQLPANLWGSSSEVSLEMWVTIGSNTIGDAVVEIGQISGSIQYSVLINGYLNFFTFFVINGESAYEHVQSSAPYVNPTDTHVVMTIASSGDVRTYKGYVNGQLVTGTATTSNTLPSSSFGGNLGKTLASAETLNGTFNEFRVWGAALTATQVSQNYYTGPDEICFDCPSAAPSTAPTGSPTVSPTLSLSPSVAPSETPTVSPTLSLSPSVAPSETPTVSPTLSVSPSVSPSEAPTMSPTNFVDAFLTSRYSFNDGTADDSIGSLDGTLESGATVADGRVTVDAGGGSYVLFPAMSDNFNMYESISLEVWYTATDANNGDNRLFAFGFSNSNYIGVYQSNGNAAIIGGNTVNSVSSFPFAPQVSDTHMVLVYAPGFVVSLYCNGELATSANTYAFPPGISTGYLGRSFNGEQQMTGTYNEFRIAVVTLDINALSASAKASILSIFCAYTVNTSYS
eukprot:gene24234-30552_t